MPSGNITMQQMVARPGRSRHLCGPVLHHRQRQGRPGRHRGDRECRQDRAHHHAQGSQHHQGRGVARPQHRQPDRLLGRQRSSSTSIMPQHGLNKGDYQEVRMDVNNMVAALAAKTVDAMVNVEPYNVIAVADGIGSDLMDFSSVDPMPVFMAATPEMVEKRPDTIVAYLKAWLDAAARLQGQSEESRRRDLRVLCRQGLQDGAGDVRHRAVARRGESRLSGDLKPYMQQQAEILLQNKTINAIPDWSKALRPDFMEKAKSQGVIWRHEKRRNHLKVTGARKRASRRRGDESCPVRIGGAGRAARGFRHRRRGAAERARRGVKGSPISGGLIH